MRLYVRVMLLFGVTLLFFALGTLAMGALLNTPTPVLELWRSGALKPTWPVAPLRIGAQTLLLSVGGVLIVRQVLVPVLAIHRTVHRLAKGDLSARISQEDPVLARRGDELGELARDFDRMAERLEGAQATQRQLLLDISPELRSPLARLSVALELGRRRCPPDAHASLDRIEREAERMNALIGEILTVARLDATPESLRREPIDLRELLQELVADADFEARADGKEVASESACASAVVSGDAVLLRRAIENVLRNAVRHGSEKGTVAVTLREISGGYRILIRDRGPGVAPEDLEKLGTPFWRAQSDRSTATGGYGLGLSIAVRAMARLGGSLSFENADGGGLEVTLELPGSIGSRSG